MNRLITRLVVLLTLTAGAASADGDPRTDGVPRLLPYQGQLELDGRPVNATGESALHIGFLLFDGADAEAHAYRQDLQIEVYGGRFTATIGPVGTDAAGTEVPIERIIANADDLYLGMILLGDPADPEDDIGLANRQRIHASPYAMWTTTATDLTVARDAVVGRNLAVTGDLTVQGAVNLSAGAIDTAEVADNAIRPSKIALGNGLRGLQNDTVGVDNGFLDARIRSWVRSHCRVSIGHRDRCDGCGTPAGQVTVQANRTCVSGSCRSAGWGGVQFTGDVDGNDDLFVRFECD